MSVLCLSPLLVLGVKPLAAIDTTKAAQMQGGLF